MVNIKGEEGARYRTQSHRLLGTTIRVGERLSKAADRFLKPYRLTLAQFNLLAVLMSEPKGIPQSKIGDRLVVSRANITGLVKRMRSRRLCRILPDPKDGRIKKVVLASAGRALMARIQAPYFRQVRRLTATLHEGELRRMSDALDRLERSL